MSQCEQQLSCFVRITGRYPQCTLRARYAIGGKLYCKAHLQAGLASFYRRNLQEIDNICCAVPDDKFYEWDDLTDGLIVNLHGAAALAIQESYPREIRP